MKIEVKPTQTVSTLEGSMLEIEIDAGGKKKHLYVKPKIVEVPEDEQRQAGGFKGSRSLLGLAGRAIRKWFRKPDA